MTYKRAFSPSEYERRIATVKTRMAVAGFDLLICQDPANMCWLTGFDGWSFYTPQAVLVHTDEAAPIWFGRAQDARSAEITTDLPAKNIISFSEPLVHHRERHPFDEMCALIIARGWARAHVGVDMDAHYYTARAHRHIIDGLPDARIEDNRELVNWARLVKSEPELALMREAGRITTRMMENAVAGMAPGVPQNELIAGIYQDQVEGVGEGHGDYAAICPLIQIDESTATPHLTWTDAPLPDSGLIVTELSGARCHYHAPLTRTIHIGQPPDAMKRLADAIVDGGDRLIEAFRPGATCEEVEAIWQKTINRHGFEKPSRVGYPIGLGFPPDWGERTASLRPGDRTVLEAGMCFHVQSGIWLDDFGAAISESLVVTDQGGERLCDVERTLIVI